MTSRRRLLAVLHRELPDCVPVCPDISNMVPCRLTGKPFWDIYAKQDPPLWKAHIDALKWFDIDGGFELYKFGSVDPLTGERSPFEERVVHRYSDGRFVGRAFDTSTGAWSPTVKLYSADNPPASNVKPEALGLPVEPTEWEPIPDVREWPEGRELWELIRHEMGDQGIVGMPSGMTTGVLTGVEDIYAYHDDPKPFCERVERTLVTIERRMKLLAELETKPDFLMCGASGSLVFQTVEMFRELALPLLKRTTELAAEIGIPTHVHSCGPEAELVRIAAEETELTVIDPLEIPPMGDCELAELKRRYGDRIILKGNLHTTETMLNGSVDDVIAAGRKAIDDAASGGGFILSTGDQCGRDTPDENLFAMVETARTYGRY